MKNRRNEIADYLVKQFKKVQKGKTINELEDIRVPDSYKPGYKFQTNLDATYRGVAFIDEINDFPTIYLAMGTETRNFENECLTTADLDAIVRIYTFSEDCSQEESEKVITDLENLIYSLAYTSFKQDGFKGIMDITIDNISFDDGLAKPYGNSEIMLNIQYMLDR